MSQGNKKKCLLVSFLLLSFARIRSSSQGLSLSSDPHTHIRSCFFSSLWKNYSPHQNTEFIQWSGYIAGTSVASIAWFSCGGICRSNESEHFPSMYNKAWSLWITGRTKNLFPHWLVVDFCWFQCGFSYTSYVTWVSHSGLPSPCSQINFAAKLGSSRITRMWWMKSQAWECSKEIRNLRALTV